MYIRHRQRASSISYLVQERLYFSPCDPIFRPCRLQLLLYFREVRAFPRSFLAIRPFKHIPHLRLHSIDSSDWDSTVPVDLPRAYPVPDLNELESDVEVL